MILSCPSLVVYKRDEYGRGGEGKGEKKGGGEEEGVGVARTSVALVVMCYQ